MAKIDLNYARQLVKNYRDTKLGNELKTDDTQSVWFSKEDLLRALRVEPSTDTEGITGIRFYFGAYEEEAGYPENPEDNNKLTLVMVPTNEDGISVERGLVTETAYLDAITDDPNGKVQPSYPEGDPIDENLIFNDGQLAPPPSAIETLGLFDW